MEARGLELKPAEEGEEADILICSRVADQWPPPVPSIRGTCTDCGDPIYWSKKTAPKSVKRRLCERCAAIVIATDKEPRCQVLRTTIEEAGEALAREAPNWWVPDPRLRRR
jgi:hypothetical protein